MALTYVQHVADGTNPIFSVPCPYIEQSHIKVKVGAFPCVLGAHYDFINSTQIRFIDTMVPVAGATVEIRRQTVGNVPLVTFQDGAILNDDDLNVATLQSLFITQEIRDYYESALVGGFNRLNNGTAVTAQEAIDAAVQEVLNSALLADLSSRIEDIENIGEQGIEHSAAIQNLNNIIDTVVGTFDPEEYAALVTAEATARAAADSAFASTLALIGATGGGGTAFVLNLSTVQVGGGVSLGTTLSGISTSLASNAAAIAAETTARTTADSSLASSISALSASVSSNQTTALAALAAEATARANADSSMASTVTTLQATVATNNSTLTAALSTVQSVVNGPSGLAAQWMVKTDVNGRVAGFGLYNTGATSEFIVLANKFAVVDPGAPGGTPVVPFVVTGGVCYLQNVVIGNAVIENAAITNAKISSLSVDGRVLDNGAVGTPKIEVDAVTQLFVTSYDFGGSPWDTAAGSTYVNWLNSALVVSHPVNSFTHKVLLTVTFVAARDGGDDDNLDIRFYDSTGGYQVGNIASNVQIFGGYRMYTYQTVFSTAVTGNHTYYVQCRSLGDGSPFIKSFTFFGQIFKR